MFGLTGKQLWIVKNGLPKDENKMTQELTKEQLELIELVKNLDVELFNRLAKRYLDSTIACRDQVYSILKECQKQKEKTLEEKLIDAGFKRYSWFEKAVKDFPFLITKIIGEMYIKNDIIVSIYENGKVGVNNQLESDYSNHDQILKDIAYLESRT